jgi:outer membrane autotransporter protein
MDRGDLRGTLLTTSSALALLVGVGGSAWAATCTVVTNPTLPYNQAGNTCVTFTASPGTIGDVNNTGTVTATGAGNPSATAISVYLGSTSIRGGITNSGAITANNNGVFLDQTTVTGSIVNTTHATIHATGSGFLIQGTGVPGTATVGGSVINNGTIISNNVSMSVGNASVGGSVINNGSLTAQSDAPIAVSEATVVGGVTNNGSIVGVTALVGIAVSNGGSIGGSVVNNGSITLQSNPNGAAIQILPSTLNNPQTITGSIVNTANATMTAAYGIEIFGTNAANRAVIGGGVTNNGTITAGITGIQILSSTIGGAIVNTSGITAGENGIELVNLTTAGTFVGTAGPVSVAGGITNSGSITSNGVGYGGIVLAGASVAGGITNMVGGTISAAQGVGIYLGNMAKVTFSSGTQFTINGGASALSGGIVNQGTITAKTGIMVTGGSTLVGGINNTGSITGTRAAIDLTGAATTITINQMAGSITGNILLSPHSDTLNITGGAITGNVVGANNATGGTVNFALGSGVFITAGTFNVNNININSGTVLLANDATVFGALTNNATLLLSSAGTRTLTGNFAQNAAGTLAMEVNPSGSALLHVTGNATLAGTLLPLYDPGVYSAKTYTLMQAASITGNFTQLSGAAPAGFTQSETTTATQVQLVLGGKGVIVPPTGATNFSATTSTLILNDQQVIELLLDQIGSHFGATGNGTGFASLGAPPAGMQMQLASLGGNTNLGAIEQVAQTLPQAIADNGGWFRGIGSFASVNGNSTAPGYSADSGGFLAGYDRAIAPDLYAGIAGGYNHSDITVSPSTGTVDTGRVLVYGGGLLGPGFWSATAGYAHDAISTARGIAGIGTATESHGGNEFNGGAQWSLPLPVTGFGGGIATLTPKLGVMYIHLGEDGFAETGADGFDLANTGKSTDSLQPFIGLNATQTFVTADGTQYVPQLRLGYSHELANDNRLLNVGAVSGASFIIQGVKPSRDQLTAGLGVTVRAQDSLYLYANYDAIVRTGNTSDQTVSAGLRIKF